MLTCQSQVTASECMVSQTGMYLSHVDFGNQQGHSGNNPVTVQRFQLMEMSNCSCHCGMKWNNNNNNKTNKSSHYANPLTLCWCSKTLNSLKAVFFFITILHHFKRSQVSLNYWNYTDFTINSNVTPNSVVVLLTNVA